MYAFMIGTHRGLYTLEICPETEVSNMQLIRGGHSYGICQFRDLIYAKQSDHHIGKYSYLDGKLEFIGKFSVELETPPKAVHQISVDKDGTLLLVDTHNNRLLRVDGSGELISIYRLGPENNDVLHLNSVFTTNSHIHLLAHMGDTPPSKLITFENRNHLEQVTERSLVYSGCHNIYLDSSHVYFNASRQGQLVKYDLSTKRTDSLNYGGHVKGMSVIQNYMVIGVSETKVRAERKLSRASIAFVNLDDFSKHRLFQLRSDEEGNEIGNVNEIRCLSHVEKSYNA